MVLCTAVYNLYEDLFFSPRQFSCVGVWDHGESLARRGLARGFIVCVFEEREVRKNGKTKLGGRIVAFSSLALYVVYLQSSVVFASII